MSQLRNHLRTLTALIAALAILACAVPAAVFAASGQDTSEMETVSSYPYTTVTKVKVNLRASRSTRSTLVKKIPAGAEITVKAVKGSWAEVTYQKYSGYVMTDYIILKKVGKVKVTPTPVPTLSPEEDAGGYQILQKGDQGSRVTALQEALIELGYLSGKADGNYGTATMNAVKAFQKANGLTVDGTAGKETQKILFSGNAKAAAKATATPAPKATEAPKSGGTLRVGSTGSDVKTVQNQLIQLGYLSGKADGIFGRQTANAVKAFQKASNLAADGLVGEKTISKLQNAASSSSSSSTPAEATTKVATSVKPSASRVQYANWYEKVKSVAKKYPYATVYDFSTGISWQVHIFSVGAHADYEPVTANDTAKLEKAFGGNTWNPKAVWVVFSDGSVYIGSTHSMPHEVQHTRDNNFAGHSCLHFPRTQEQVTAIGPYATKHQEIIDAGWNTTQKLT